jgi:branched-chain amino acid transport system permease protein
MTRVLDVFRRFGVLVPVVAGVIIAFLPAMGLVESTLQQQLALAAVYALVVAGFNLAYGLGGQLALGQVAVFAGGAYTAAILYQSGVRELAIALPLSVIAAAVLGLVTGIPGLRLNQWALALTAFFLVLIIPNVTGIFESETGGAQGLPGILSPTLFGVELDRNRFYTTLVLATTAVLLLYRNMVVSRYGNALQVLKEGAQLTQAVGVSPLTLRISSYVIGSLPAGIAGVFYAYLSAYVSPMTFNFALVTLVLAASVVGGTSSMWGAAVGSALLVILPHQMSSFSEYSVLVFGAFLVAAGLASGSRLKLAVPWLTRLRRTEPPKIDEANVDADMAIPGKTLQVRGVSKAFGGAPALVDVDLNAEPGQITAIIGANGAGKTTLLNAISGLIPIDGGQVTLGSRDLTELRAATRARHGVSRTFQTPQIPGAMSVLDVVMGGRLANHSILPVMAAIRAARYRTETRVDAATALSALRMCGLDHLRSSKASELPLGQRRLLEVARSIAAAPALLLLDEPAAGLDASGLVELKNIIVRARAAGATIILVEHNVKFVMENADRVVAMNLGRVIADGAPAQVRDDDVVIESYLGKRHAVARQELPAPAVPNGRRNPPTDPPRLSVATVAPPDVRRLTSDETGEPILRVEDVRYGYGDLVAVWDASFVARPGCVTAIVGANGAGKSTLMWGLAGLIPSTSGKVFLEGEDITHIAPHERTKRGLGLVPEGKRVLRDMTVHENLMLGVAGGAPRGSARGDTLGEFYDRFEILKQKRGQQAGALSGGQQQLLAIVSALITKPKVLLVDEPSSGLSPVAVDSIIDLLVELKSEGLAVVLVEQQVEAVLSGAADRVIVVEEGRISLNDDASNVSLASLEQRIYAR